MLRVLVLGELAAEYGGTPLELPAGRPGRALLGYLALHPGRHGRAALAARFWPDVLDESARTSLRGALADVRRALGPAAGAHVLATREHLGLVDCVTDAADAAALAAAGRPDDALALWRDELLAGLEAGDWLVAARDADRARRGALMAALAERAAAAGDHAAAVARARERVALEPLAEDAGRDLVARLAAAGDRAAALTAYARLADRLRTELGIAPSRATRELADRIRAGGAPDPTASTARAADPAARAADTSRPAARAADTTARAADPAARAPDATYPRDAPTPGDDERGTPAAAPALPAPFAGDRERSPFVGRERERDVLLAAVDAVRDGRRRVVLVAGEPGIGKTRLVAEVARRAHAGGATILAGRCHEEPPGPFAPFVEALRPLGGLQAEPAADPGAARLRLFEAAAATLAAAAGSRPVVLVLEDLHWADRPTLLLLAHLASASDPAALLILGTYRQTDLGRRHPLAAMLADLRRDRRVQRVALDGLGADAATRLVGGWVGADAAPELAARVQAETEGNPFFIEEVLRDLLEGGALVRRDGAWRAAGPLRVPESVREVIGRRVERLSDDAVAVLETAAVCGREFSLALLSATGLFGRDRLLDALEEAERAHVVRPAATGGLSAATGGGWAFSHALVREALYDELASLRRARLHAAVTDALVATAGPPAEAAAHAYEAAALEGPARAVALAEEAAAEALDALAYEDAAGQLERALQALDLDPDADPLRRADLLLARGDALARAGDPEALAVFAAARALAKAAGDAERLARAALGACGVGVTIIDVDRERAALLEEALDALRDEAPALRARLLARLAIELAYAPGRDRSGALGEAAVAAARQASEPDALLAALNARHVALWYTDGLAERFATAEEMIELATAHGRREAELQGRHWRAIDLWEAGDITGFVAEAERHGALADALRLDAFRWYTPMWRAALAMLRGDHAAATLLVEEALPIGHAAHDANAELAAKMIGFWIVLQERDFASLDGEFLDDKINHSPAGVAYRGARAWRNAELGRTEAARAELEWLAADDFARVPRDFNELSAVGDCAEPIAVIGAADLAALAYAWLARYAGRQVVAGRAVHNQGPVDYPLGRLAATMGRLDAARAHLETALALVDAIGARGIRVQVLARLAEVLAAAGETGAAQDRATRAVADAAALGLPRTAVPPGAAALAGQR